METINIKNEIFSITSNQTLVLNNPAQVTFLNNGNSGENVLINNSLLLCPYVDNLTGGITGVYSTSPTSITIQSNSGEIDTTNYQIIFPTGAGILTVICKYYVNNK